MRIHNVLTPQDKKTFSSKRNACLGHLTRAKNSFTNMVESDLVDSKDKKILRKLVIVINFILKRWDRHYTSNLFTQKDL